MKKLRCIVGLCLSLIGAVQSALAANADVINKAYIYHTNDFKRNSKDQKYLSDKSVSDVNDSADFKNFSRKRKVEDTDCTVSSTEATETGICKIDVYMTMDNTTGENPCSAELTDKVDLSKDHLKVQWVVKSRHDKDQYSYEFFNDWTSIPAILLVDSSDFSAYDGNDKKKFFWTGHKNSSGWSSKYLLLIKWRKSSSSGFCQLIDPVIANS